MAEALHSSITDVHCLRPTFTRNLIHTLLERRRSVNLIGPPGCGKRRLLEDVRDCKLPDTLVLLLDLRAHKQSYAGFLDELWRQCPHANGEAVPPDLGDLLTKLENSGQWVLLLLDHFDALFSNLDIDPKFDVRFHDHLNSLKNHPRMALACVTVEPHDCSVIFVGGQPCGTSWLDLEKRVLPPLSGPEVRAEILRQQSKLDAETAAAIFETVYSHGRSYALLTEILNKWANRESADWPLRKRLEAWRRQFETATNGVCISALHRRRRTFRAWWATAGLPNPKQLAKALGSPLAALGRLIEQWGKGGGDKP